MGTEVDDLATDTLVSLFAISGLELPELRLVEAYDVTDPAFVRLLALCISKRPK